MTSVIKKEVVKIYKKGPENSSLFDCTDQKIRRDNNFTNKLKNAKKSFGQITFKNEENLFLLDDTVFGSSSEGLLITTKGLYYKNLGEEPQRILFKDHHKASKIKDNSILIGDIKIGMTYLSESTKIVVDIINKLLEFNNDTVKIGENYNIDGVTCRLTSDGLMTTDGKYITYTYTDAVKLIKNKNNEGSKQECTKEVEKISNSPQPKKNMIAKAIESMAMLDNKSKHELKVAAKGNSFDEWKLKCISKSSGVGFLTGLAGGPAGIALEVADTGYLMSMAGRACYGVGHLHNKPIDYDNDIEGILAIWCGAGKSIDKTELAINTAVPIAGKIAIKLSTKVTAKLAMKIAAKASAKIIGKAGAKIAGKVAGKMSTKWIPGIGGIVSAGINWWVLDGLIDAAEEYYTSDYVLLNEDMVDE